MYLKSILISTFMFSLGIGYGQTEEMIEQIPESKLSYSLGAMGLQGSSGQIEDAYSFDHSVKLQSEVFKDKGKESQKSIMDIYYSDGSSKFGMTMNSPQIGSTHIVYDYENGQMITMMDNGGSKVGMATGFDVDEIMKSQSIDTSKKVKFEKTGDTETISGYACEEYILISDSDTEVGNQQSVWMTTDIDSNWMQSMTKIAQSKNMFGMSDDISTDIPQGTVIKMITKDSNDNVTMAVTVEEINENKSIELKTTEYTFMNFGGQMPSK